MTVMRVLKRMMTLFLPLHDQPRRRAQEVSNFQNFQRPPIIHIRRLLRLRNSDYGNHRRLPRCTTSLFSVVFRRLRARRVNRVVLFRPHTRSRQLRRLQALAQHRLRRHMDLQLLHLT